VSRFRQRLKRNRRGRKRTGRRKDIATKAEQTKRNREGAIANPALISPQGRTDTREKEKGRQDEKRKDTREGPEAKAEDVAGLPSANEKEQRGP